MSAVCLNCGGENSRPLFRYCPTCRYEWNEARKQRGSYEHEQSQLEKALNELLYLESKMDVDLSELRTFLKELS
jgi:hypothetical protein